MNGGGALPEELVEKIITHFPVNLAARAAIVSRRFINTWRLNRNLHFDAFRQPFPEATFAQIIHHVMNQHSGPKIDRMFLSMDPSGHENRIHEWIRMAIDKGVEELDLQFLGNNPDQALSISSELMNGADSMRVLKVRHCDIQFSPQMNGLKFLKTLRFERILLDGALMDSIFGNCLALEDLELLDCSSSGVGFNILARKLENFRSLKIVQYEVLGRILINAPNLETFSYSGEVFEVDVIPSPRKLNVARLNFQPSFRHIRRVTHLVSSLRYCKSLQICIKILEGLCPKFREFEYTELLFSFPNLLELRLFLDGANVVNPYDIIYFLKNCPVINSLVIELGDDPFEEGMYWKLDAKPRFEKYCPYFQFLKKLTIKKFKYTNLEFQLLKVIVENAPSLEDVTLVKCFTRRATLEREQFLDWVLAQRCNFDVHEDPN